MSRAEHEALVEAAARFLCPIDPDSDMEIVTLGIWYRPGIPHWRSHTEQARAAIALIAQKLETVTEEMATAWTSAGTEAYDFKTASKAEVEMAHAKGDWLAMLAASPLSPALDAARKAPQ